MRSEIFAGVMMELLLVVGAGREPGAGMTRHPQGGISRRYDRKQRANPEWKCWLPPLLVLMLHLTPGAACCTQLQLKRLMAGCCCAGSGMGGRGRGRNATAIRLLNLLYSRLNHRKNTLTNLQHCAG
jgi:hypothetical protein